MFFKVSLSCAKYVRKKGVFLLQLLRLTNNIYFAGHRHDRASLIFASVANHKNF